MKDHSKYKETLIGDIVADDFRAAEVFNNAGIDFCCGGKMSLESACNEKNIDPTLLIQEFQKLEDKPISPSQNFKEWNLDFLADFIMNTHHKYVLKTLPELLFYTQKIASVHGDHHPELIEIADLFAQINDELLQHLKNEEEVLFPAIKDVLQNNSQSSRAIIKSEIDRMSGEHDFAGGSMDKINILSSGYQLPENACQTYMLTFKLLKQFEDDLHIHVHLENNILFPKALSI